MTSKVERMEWETEMFIDSLSEKQTKLFMSILLDHAGRENDRIPSLWQSVHRAYVQRIETTGSWLLKDLGSPSGKKSDP